MPVCGRKESRRVWDDNPFDSLFLLIAYSQFCGLYALPRNKNSNFFLIEFCSAYVNDMPVALVNTVCFLCYAFPGDKFILNLIS